MYHNTPTWKALKNTVVNWLSEQFVYPTCTCKNFKCNKSNKKKVHNKAHVSNSYEYVTNYWYTYSLIG